MGPAGFIAVLAGWVTTEVGRQPYTVYGLLRTADSVSPVAAPAVAGSLVAFIVIYTVVFGAGIFYLLRLMRRPPHPGRARDGAHPDPHGRHHPRPWSPARGSMGPQHEGPMMAIDLAFVWAILIAFAVLAYVHARRLRSRHRHPVPGIRRARAARRHDQLGSAGLGRQRDLAGAGRRRPARRVSAGLRGAAAGALCAADRDAAGAGAARRRLRVPLSHHPGEARLGLRLLGRLGAGGADAGDRARRLHPGLRGRGARLCRRLVGLADARSAS